MAKEIQSDEFKKLILLGEEKGFLTYDDVNDMLPPDVTSSDQIDDIIMLFGEKNIDIIDTEQGEKLLVKKAAEDIVPSKFPEALSLVPGIGKTGDPVKMYLREMGLVSLLSREGEVEIAKKIEEGAREAMGAIFRLSVSIKEVLNIGDKLLTGEIRLKSVVDNIEDEAYVEGNDSPRKKKLSIVQSSANDNLDKKLDEILIGVYNKRRITQIPFRRLSQGEYEFGSQKLLLKVEGDIIRGKIFKLLFNYNLVKTGGGFILLDKFIEINAPLEEAKIQRAQSISDKSKIIPGINKVELQAPGKNNIGIVTGGKNESPLIKKK